MKQIGLNKYQYKFKDEQGKELLVKEIIGRKPGVVAYSSVGGFGEDRLDRTKLKEEYYNDTNPEQGILSKELKLCKKILQHEKNNTTFDKIIIYKDDEPKQYVLIERSRRDNA